MSKDRRQEIRIGNDVEKIDGGEFTGVVVSRFLTTREEPRIVVESSITGRCRVFNPELFRTVVKEEKKEFRNAFYVELGEVAVNNPYFSYDHKESQSNPKVITATANIRESPAMWMKKYGNMTDAQFAAALLFRVHLEKTGARTIRAIDTTKEPVSGGRFHDGITDARNRAAKAMEDAEKLLGKEAFELVTRVFGHCNFLEQIYKSKYERLKKAQLLYGYLDQLAEHWGLATQRKQAS